MHLVADPQLIFILTTIPSKIFSRLSSYNRKKKLKKARYHFGIIAFAVTFDNITMLQAVEKSLS